MELANINSATGPPTRKLAAVSPVGHLDEEPETSPESNLLIGAIVNTEFLAMLNRLEIPRLLENKWAKILHRVLTEYYQTYKKAPGATVTELIGCLTSDLDATDYGLILHTIKAAQKRYNEGGAEFDLQFNLDLTEKYLQSRAIVLHREEEKLLLKAGKFEEAGKLLEDFKLPSLAVDEKNSLKNALADPGLVMTFREFRELDHPPKEHLLLGSFPLEKSSITIISGETGAGKTFFQMELARIMAGAEYGLAGLIHADVPRKVCYIDGELPEGELVDRIDALELDRFPNLTLISKSWLEKNDISPALNVNDETVRNTLSEYLITNKFDLVVLDNLYSLFSGLDMNDGPAWQPTNDWFLRLRAKGIAVILSHHPNRAGSQLGTITKTWNINNLLELKKATPADGEECCCFNIAVSKERGLGIKLAGRNYIFRNRVWATESKKLDTAAVRKAAVIFLLAENKHTQEHIAAEVRLDRSRVSHIKREVISTNLLLEDAGNLSLTPAGQLYIDKHFKENYKMILLGINDG